MMPAACYDRSLGQHHQAQTALLSSNVVLFAGGGRACRKGPFAVRNSSEEGFLTCICDVTNSQMHWQAASTFEEFCFHGALLLPHAAAPSCQVLTHSTMTPLLGTSQHSMSVWTVPHLQHPAFAVEEEEEKQQHQWAGLHSRPHSHHWTGLCWGRWRLPGLPCIQTQRPYQLLSMWHIFWRYEAQVRCPASTPKTTPVEDTTTPYRLAAVAAMLHKRTK